MGPYKEFDFNEFSPELAKIYNNNFNDFDENGNYKLSKKSKNILNVPETVEDFKPKIVWRNVIIFLYIHLAGIYGLYVFVLQSNWKTVLFTVYIGSCVAYGITAGAHRLWAHKSYKANAALRTILMLCQTLAAQNSIYEWCRDHRVHHKFPDSNADPHNINRGFFFAHMGWLLMKKHPDVKAKGKMIDMSDLERDQIVMFQHNYYMFLVPIVSFIIPFLFPIYFLDETVHNSFYVIVMFRYAWSLNVTWSINSFSHLLGMKPYDKNISPCNNPITSFVTMGEGWHNYHHIFPWDYKAAELGNYGLNWTVAVIDFFAKIGWAYDLKTVSQEMIRKRIERTGDGSHKWSRLKTPQEQLSALINDPEFHDSEEPIWGWEDKDINKDDLIDANILHKSK